MLLALGMEAFGKDGKQVGVFGKDVELIEEVNLTTLDPRLKNVEIKVASDVDNPLCGERGASVVYGPQKGATEEQVRKYDAALNKFAHLIESKLNVSIQEVPGAGAAGGLGFALLLIEADVVSGAQLIADAMDMEDSIQDADLVITGEGQRDRKSTRLNSSHVAISYAVF